MFRRELYRAMKPVLDAFDGEALERTSFRFGGGVRLALDHDEFRASADLDFLCADGDGYRELRLVREDLRKAAVAFLEGEAFRERCFSGLAVEAGFRTRILAGVSAIVAET